MTCSQRLTIAQNKPHMSSTKHTDFRSISFFPNGEPDGVRIVEKSLWTGQGVVCPRSLFPETKRRQEFQKTGVYVLTGISEETGNVKAYIGEGDPVFNRLNDHYAKKDFWTRAVFFTSKDANLNKAHVQYLESRLITLAREAKQCELDNGNFPALPSLSEPDIAYMEGFLQNMLHCLPVLDIRFFEIPNENDTARKIKMLYFNAKDIKAFGYESGDGFVVCKDSQAVLRERPSIPNNIKENRQNLLTQKVLVESNGVYVFTQDYLLSSASRAASVVLGGGTSGLDGTYCWRNENGVKLKEIRESESKD